MSGAFLLLVKNPECNPDPVVSVQKKELAQRFISCTHQHNLKPSAGRERPTSINFVV